MAMNSRMNSWTLMKILVVPCLFLCAIFKHPAFQWIACVALAIWVCFMLANVIRLRLKKREKAAAPATKATDKDALPAPENAETDEARLSLLRQVNHNLVNLVFRADVNTAGRLIHYQDIRIICQPA